MGGITNILYRHRYRQVIQRQLSYLSQLVSSIQVIRYHVDDSVIDSLPSNSSCYNSIEYRLLFQTDTIFNCYTCSTTQALIDRYMAMLSLGPTILIYLILTILQCNHVCVIHVDGPNHCLFESILQFSKHCLKKSHMLPVNDVYI